MKTLSLTLLALIALTPTAFSFGGSGPWADGAYYPGGLNGKYVGIVSGNNIAGVIGFAIVEGAPPFRTTEQQQADAGVIDVAVTVNENITPDVLQNYFAIFVEGRTYSGVTLAGINIKQKLISGALQGQNPAGLLAFDVFETLEYRVDPAAPAVPILPESGLNAARNALSIVNRGLSGGFTAKIRGKQNVFTFRGDGELSTAANQQTFEITSVPLIPPTFLPPDNVPPGIITNQVVSARVITETTPFTVNGIRTSLFANNPSGQEDQQSLAAGAASGGGN